MSRLLPIALTLLSPVAFAQTTLDITVPGGAVCSYSTGPVSNGSASGHLQATATSSTGAGCGSGSSGNVTFGPASPVAATPVSVYNGTSSISFRAINANSCTGTITPSTGTFTGGNPLCTGAACQAPVTVVAQFDNESTTQTQNYTVSVTCTGTGGQASSQVIVNVPKKGDIGGSCFTIPNSAGGSFVRMTAPILTNRNDGNSVNRDSTSFDSIFGTTSSPHWPGAYGITTNVFLPTDKYLALAFTVPQGFFTTPPNVGVYGHYKLNGSSITAPVSMSISKSCGDFSAPGGSSSTVCVANNLYTDQYIGWTSTAGSACMLESGKSYYLNLINATVENVLPNGAGSATSTAPGHCSGTCEDTPTNKTGNWKYVP